jgi:NRAMP (natural resistance-associated macrophage protein)-like metal ion transporter
MKKVKKIFGPGFTTGASDNDPSGIATYSQAGAQFGYGQLWTAIFTLPFLIVVQEMCTRISIVSKKGLATLLRENYHKSIAYFTCFVLAIGNTVNIGADLNAMAECASLILNLNFYVYLFFFVFLTLALEIFVPYKKYSKILLFFSFFLILYIFVVFRTEQDWKAIMINTILPTLKMNKDYLLNIIAILGTTISPYMFFWQSEQHMEEMKIKCKTQKLKKIKKSEEIKGMRVDTVTGMFISNIFMFFIIIVSSATLHVHGITNIESASQAAKALEPIAGNFASIIFAVGVIALGLLSIPVLAGTTAYVFSEVFIKKKGLDNKFHQAKFFYIVIIISVVVGLCTNFIPIKPFKMLYYSAVINGALAPILIFIIILLANNKKIMGKKSNGVFSNVVSGLLILLLVLSLIVFLVFLF